VTVRLLGTNALIASVDARMDRKLVADAVVEGRRALELI
jgi:hypothetical protein